MRIEIILDDGLLDSGQPIQLRVKRYLEYTVFHVLIYYKELRKYEQRTIYVKLPCQFLSSYSHRPFKENKHFDLYQLEPELTYKFVNFDEENEKEPEKGGGPDENRDEEEEEINVDTLNNSSGSNETDGVKFLNNRMDPEAERISPGNAADWKNVNPIGKNLTIIKPTATSTNSSIGPAPNKFAEQVLPIRGYYKLQTTVFPALYIEMTDNAETYDGLISNLVKVVDDENEFLKPLNLIYLANLNNFDSYFGLNKTFNTSTTTLTKNIQSITSNVLQSNKTTTNFVPLLSLLNNTISKINLTNSLNSSLQDSLKNSLKISLESSMQSAAQNDSVQQEGGQSGVQTGTPQNQTQSGGQAPSGGSPIKTQSGSSIKSPIGLPIKSQSGSPTKTDLQSSSKTKSLGSQLNRAKASGQLAQNSSAPTQSGQDNSTTTNEERTNTTSSFNHKNFTQIYIGNVDNNNTLSTLPPFVGCISGIIFNNQLINLTKITEKRYADQLKSGRILTGCKMLCSIKNCQNGGACLDNWMTNQTLCNCTNTSYTGDRCDEDLGSAFNSLNHLFYRLDPRRPRNLLEDQVTFELAFNFAYEEYFSERKNRYYHQEIDETNMHKHSNRLYAEERVNKWNFDNRILLLIIYETRYLSLISADYNHKDQRLFKLILKYPTDQRSLSFRYILLYVNKDNSIILSDVDNKGNGMGVLIEILMTFRLKVLAKLICDFNFVSICLFIFTSFVFVDHDLRAQS